jgi:hypothetical protein
MESNSNISSPARVCIFGLLLELVGVHAGFLLPFDFEAFPPDRDFPAYTIGLVRDTPLDVFKQILNGFEPSPIRDSNMSNINYFIPRIRLLDART